jgi:hypothetical protein
MQEPINKGVFSQMHNSKYLAVITLLSHTRVLTEFICLQTVTELVKDQISPKLLGWVAELSEENKKVLLCFETNKFFDV